LTDNSIAFRYEVRPDDRETVRRLVDSTGVFSPVEIDVAVELVDDRIQRGKRSDYYFVFAEVGEKTVGYACYGPIALTAASSTSIGSRSTRPCKGGGSDGCCSNGARN